ncbi:hypothetical protein ACJQWK_11840 [Exserohilum turcicum]
MRLSASGGQGGPHKANGRQHALNIGVEPRPTTALSNSVSVTNVARQQRACNPLVGQDAVASSLSRILLHAFSLYLLCLRHAHWRPSAALRATPPHQPSIFPCTCASTHAKDALSASVHASLCSTYMSAPWVPGVVGFNVTLGWDT